MSTNGNRLDRIEKARGDGRISRKVGSVYACVSGCITMGFSHARGDPTWHLRHGGKIIVNADGIRWARDDQDHPDARYPETENEMRLAHINALCLPDGVNPSGRFTEAQVQAAFDLIITELKAGIEPEINW